MTTRTVSSKSRAIVPHACQRGPVVLAFLSFFLEMFRNGTPSSKRRSIAVVCYLRSQNESDRCDCRSDWDRAVVIRSAAGPVGDASKAGQEALVYGVRKFRQLRKIFSTVDYWS
jgi:hypothetical protein